jgi:WD40 repeat protein
MFSRSLSCLLLLLSLCTSGIRAAEKPARFDCHGDPLPPHALARLGTVRFLHGGDIECLAYSPDGKLLASASVSTIVLWDAQSGRKVHTLDCQPNSVRTLAFSPDSKLLVSSSGIGLETHPELRLWDVTTGKLVFALPETKEHAKVVAFSPDGKIIWSAHYGNQIHSWDTQTGKLIRVWSCGNADDLKTVFAFAPDGKVLATASGQSEGKIRLWDLKTETVLPIQTKEAGEVSQLCFSPNGAFLAAASLKDVRLFQVSTLAQKQRFAKAWGTTSIAFFPDNTTLVNGSINTPICLWDVDSGKSTTSEQIKRWIVQLDDEDFAIREQAFHKLEGVGRETDEALECVLKTDCSPEMRRRVEMLLETRKRGNIPGIRALRAVELLEQIGTAEAMEVLRQLEKKTADGGIRAEVQRSLRRWADKMGTP